MPVESLVPEKYHVSSDNPRLSCLCRFYTDFPDFRAIIPETLSVVEFLREPFYEIQISFLVVNICIYRYIATELEDFFYLLRQKGFLKKYEILFESANLFHVRFPEKPCRFHTRARVKRPLEITYPDEHAISYRSFRDAYATDLLMGTEHIDTLSYNSCGDDHITVYETDVFSLRLGYTVVFLLGPLRSFLESPIGICFRYLPGSIRREIVHDDRFQIRIVLSLQGQ